MNIAGAGDIPIIRSFECLDRIADAFARLNGTFNWCAPIWLLLCFNLVALLSEFVDNGFDPVLLEEYWIEAQLLTKH